MQLRESIIVIVEDGPTRLAATFIGWGCEISRRSSAYEASVVVGKQKG